MKERKWLRWTVLFLLVLLFAVPALGTKEAQASTVASGTCGDDLTWKLSSSGKLTISGSEKMDTYKMTEGEYGDYSTKYPWYEYYDQITAVTIKSGTTSIGKYTVTSTGKGDYTGSVKKTFKIVPKKLSRKETRCCSTPIPKLQRMRRRPLNLPQG